MVLLLYLVKHSLTEISNAVHEVSKCIEKVNMTHYKALLRAINYLIDTEDYFYQMKPYGNINRPWELRDNSDADYAIDNDTNFF